MIDNPKRYIFYSILLLILSTNIVSGQINLVYPSSPNAVLHTNFYKQVTTWNWFGHFDMANTINNSWHWQVMETFQSNLLTPSKGKKQWKDEHNFKGYFHRQAGYFLLGLYSKSWLQSDKQVSANNQFANHAIGAFTVFNHKNRLRLTPYLGYQQSKNRTRIDWGWDAGLKGGVNNLHLGDYRTNFDIESNYDLYDKRQNFNNKFDVHLSAQFSRYTSDSLSFIFSENSKQYYAAADSNNLLKVKIYNRELRNKLFYNFSPRTSAVFSTRLQSRNISYISDRKIFNIENQIHFLHYGDRFNYGLTLRTNDETLDNSGVSTDSRTRQTAMSLQMDYRFNSRKQLNFNFSYVKLQYDTPNINNDDRDEQRFVFNLNYFHRFSPVLYMDWLAYVYLYHQIYIHKKRSVNNNWNRVFKLNPKINYRYKRISNCLSTQVLANYSVYDFEKQSTNIKSFVFRKYMLSDSLTYRFFSQNFIGVYTRIELEDKGSFFAEDFAQKILQSYNSQLYNFFLYNNHFLYFNIKAGYTIYKRREWRHAPVKRKSRDITNQGPYLCASYHHSKRLIFSAYAAISKLKDSSNKPTTYTSGYLRLYYNI